MAFKVSIDSFEGPFDLLLRLVSRQKVAIGSVSISQIADQFLEELGRMERLDLDVASDFLLVASTLLQIKAESLLPKPVSADMRELEELTDEQAREVLAERLVRYKQFKNAAAAMDGMLDEALKLHPRPFGPDPQFLAVLPDFLRQTTLDDLGMRAAACLARREVFLLESEHIAAKPIPLEKYVRSLYGRIAQEKHASFSQLVGPDAPTAIVVVSFLAVLELFKRDLVNVAQRHPFGDITVTYVEHDGPVDLAFEGGFTSAGEES